MLFLINSHFPESLMMGSQLYLLSCTKDAILISDFKKYKEMIKEFIEEQKKAVETVCKDYENIGNLHWQSMPKPDGSRQTSRMLQSVSVWVS